MDNKIYGEKIKTSLLHNTIMGRYACNICDVDNAKILNDVWKLRVTHSAGLLFLVSLLAESNQSPKTAITECRKKKTRLES